jgi:hypothetical protein
MSRDPFDEMKGMNPVPSEDQPPAPMAMAERIIGKGARPPRRAWSGLAVATTAAMAVIAVGGVMLWLARPVDQGGVGNGGTTTTAAPAVTASIPTGPAYVEVSAFFFADVENSWAEGPFLIPVAVEVEARDGGGGEAQLVHQALAALAAGPAAELEGFSTAVPEGSTVLGVSVETEVATVNLSGEFVGGGGTFSMMGRLAQVVYTVTAVDGISGVRFQIEGQPTTVFGGEGVMIDDPATRDEFESLLPAIMIESPAHNGTAGNPLVAFGTARVFEATVSIALTDDDGLIIWEGFTTATDSMDRRGDWAIEIPYDVDTAQWGSLIVWESSAEDGRQTNVREHRVWLVPADGATTVTTTYGLDE